MNNNYRRLSKLKAARMGMGFSQTKAATILGMSRLKYVFAESGGRTRLDSIAEQKLIDELEAAYNALPKVD